MEKIPFGKTGLEVTPLVYGTLPLGPLQADVSPEKGGELIRFALERGVSMIDTAYLYGTFDHVREGLRGYKGKAIVASKTHATDPAKARRHVEEALERMDIERLDVLLLHGARIKAPSQSGQRCSTSCAA